MFFAEPRVVFPTGQWSFSPSVVFHTVILRFCCRAAMDWPRAPLLVTVSLYDLIRLRERIACWQFLLLPLFTSLSNSGRTTG
jgi:hypothetical protein